MKKLLVLLITFPFLLSINCFGQSVTTTVIANVHCYGQSNGSVMANPAGGVPPYTYQWLPGSQTNQIANALAAGTYTVHLHDNLGHTATASATVTQPTGLTLSVSAKQSAVCGGQSDSLFASAGGGTVPYQYAWTAPLDDISPDTGTHVNSYPYGVAYMVTAVNDLNGCTATGAVSVTVHTPPVVSITGPLSPVIAGHSDTLIALAAGATSYLWSNGNTHSSIIVSPAVSTTYSVKATNTYSCYDTAHYTIDTNSVGNGNSSGNAIRIVPNTSVITSSYSTLDSVVWFSFIAVDSNTQIISYGNWLGLPTPHVHRLTLYNNSMQTIVDEPMPDIAGASQIRIDISHLNIGSTYYVRAARCPAHANMAGCNPSTHGVCNSTQRWDFQMCFRTVPVFVPDDSGAEAPSLSQLYYEDRGQVADLNDIPRFDIKAYTNIASPAVYASDSAVSFVYSAPDSVQRVDMILAGGSVQPSKPVFKMEEDSGAGYLNYFKEFAPNGVPKIEGYSRLVYKNVYANVDMQVYSNNVGTKLYFVCNPAGSGIGAGNPANIELQFQGASSVTVNGGGGLEVATQLGTLTFAPGFAYTDSAGIVKAKSWQAYFVAVNSNTVKFNTGAYNSSEPLVIEVDRGHVGQLGGSCNQNLCWSTYYGGTGAGNLGSFLAVAHDDSGSVYVAGYTTSKHFPLQKNYTFLSKKYAGDTDAVVVKYSYYSYKLQWAAYYGGSGCDIARGIAVDTSKEAYITGSTNSIDFPKNQLGSYNQPYLNGNDSGPNTDLFVAKFTSNATGANSALYGGPGNESGHSIALGNSTGTMFYVVGDGDKNTPLAKKAGAFYADTGTGLILRFDSKNGNYDTTWATLIGGDSTGLNACAVDKNDNLYIAGASGSGYPIAGTYAGPFVGGAFDAAITKFNSSDAISWSTCYGGDGEDVANAIAVDGFGNAYITGHTYSPVTPTGLIPLEIPDAGVSFYQGSNGNAFYGGNNGNVFIAEFSRTTDTAFLNWGTYFGDTTDIDAYGICVDGNNNIYITGYAQEKALVWPAPNNVPPNAYVEPVVAVGTTREAYIAAFNPVQGYYWATYLGGYNAPGNSVGNAITAYNAWDLYVAGGDYQGPGIRLVNPNRDSTWFQDTVGHASSIGFISAFNLIGIPTDIRQLKVESGELKIYPNPTNNNVTSQLNLRQPGMVEYKIYTLLGVLIYSDMENEPAGTTNKQFSLSALPNGNYILQVTAGNDIYHAKITKLQ